MQLRKISLTIALALALAALAGCSKPSADVPSRETFETGLRTFLADGHDQICLAMYDWPIDLTEAEAGAGSRHAVQLPVFEKLGLARSIIVPAPKSAESPDGAIKRYELTDEGRKYYKAHAYIGRNGTAHQNDFCVARLSVQKVESWQLDTHDAQHPSATVSYSYQVETAPWLKDPDAMRILPMVAKVVNGAGGTLQMHQGFVLGPQGWAAVSGAV